MILVHARALGASIAPATPFDRGLDFAYHLGWTGVDLFFVLSGFLITGILIDTRGTPHYFRSFYIRRFLRIFPLYYAALALETFVVFPLANHRGPWSDVSAADLAYFWVYLANWRTGHGLYVPLVTHFWSLSVEEHFYLVWPLAVAVLGFTGLLRLTACGVLGCVALRCWWLLQGPVPPYLLYHWTPFRVEPLLVGAVGALAVRSQVLDAFWQQYRTLALTLASAILVAVLWFAGDPGPESPAMQCIGYSSIAVIFGAGVYEASSPSRANHLYARVLRMPRLRNIGKVSYAMYICNGLFSWVVLHLLTILAVRGWLPDRYWFEATLAAVLIFVSSYAAAWASWRYFESRILALKETWAPYPGR